FNARGAGGCAVRDGMDSRARPIRLHTDGIARVGYVFRAEKPGVARRAQVVPIDGRASAGGLAIYALTCSPSSAADPRAGAARDRVDAAAAGGRCSLDR